MSKTFLELCQFVAEKTGTITPGSPLSVVAQTGRLLKVVNRTNDGWRAIQTSKADWLWMRKEFTKAAIIGIARYTGAGLGITDFARWVRNPETYTIYDPAIGVADESPLAEIPWADWRVLYGRGNQVPNRPTHFAITPANEIVLGCIPDKAYVFKGEYMQAVQELTGDGDVPNLPSDFHILIGWKGLLLLAEDDEAATQVSTAQFEHDKLYSALCLPQLEKITFAPNPLA